MKDLVRQFMQKATVVCVCVSVSMCVCTCTTYIYAFELLVCVRYDKIMLKLDAHQINSELYPSVQALAIVMDSFSDVELLCDLLGASRKRNVSVHLLLDHLNLDLFISMWKELQLDSKNFPVSHHHLYFTNS